MFLSERKGELSWSLCWRIPVFGYGVNVLCLSNMKDLHTAEM